MNRLSSIVMLALVAGCFEAKELPPAPGGESNFLRSCDGACGSGLSCVCGVCTRTCSGDAACGGLAANAVCVMPASGSCDAPKAPVCEVQCSQDRQCGAGLRCDAGVCRERPASAEMMKDAGPPAPAADTTLPADAPFVMLLVDTSGSMSDLPGCTCASPTDCNNCVPNCEQGQQNRWYTLLGVLTGSYSSFACHSAFRTADEGATYDEGYAIPNYVLESSTTQGDDGIVDTQGLRAQIALATFDSEFTYRGGSDLIFESTPFDFGMSTSAMGMYSYGGAPPGSDRVRPDGTVVGKVFYDPMPAPAYVDTGIRSGFGGTGVFDGALTVPARDLPLHERSQQVRAQLRGARPYGGTPTAAALDDLYFFFDQDEMGRQIARERRRHIVLITDGAPDPDYRELAGSTPSDRLILPYPLASEAARHLRCGYDTTGCNGLIDAVHVVAFDVHDQDVLDKLDQIAAEGGSERARRANDAAGLRRELDAIFAAVHAP